MIAGRVWKFGDDINTDLIMPGPALYLPEEERIRYIFQANRPGWVDEMMPGDIIVGGRKFGVGSSRPAALSLRNVGIACLLAESINGLFFRNCVSFGLLALECPGVHAAFEEGDTAEIALDRFEVRNARSGATLACAPLPDKLLALMQGGGILPVLDAEGLLEPL